MITYKDLAFMEKAARELAISTGVKANTFRKYLDEEKRKLRARNKDVSDRIIVKNYGMDGIVVKFPLPDAITSAEDADEYFMDYEYLHYRPTYYDCTGQHFTNWYKIFQKPDGSFWAYHSIGVDV